MPAAVAERSGQASFSVSGSATAQLRDGGELVVRTVALDELVFEHGVPAPSVMKVDVEGAEAGVLRGAGRVLATYRPAILLSTHGPDVRAACHGLLVASGYRLTVEEGTQRAGEADEVIAVPSPHR